jgi:hypothetical protein
VIEDLADYMTDVAVSLRKQGGATESVLHDWAAPGYLPTRGERGGGMVDAEPDATIAQRREAAAAAGLQKEWRTRTRRLLVDLKWLEQTMLLANPDAPKTLATKDMLVAQVEADGWCGSCWRDEQDLTAITMQKARNGAEVPMFKGRCEWCGRHRSKYGEDPPLEAVRIRHSGGRVMEKA